MRKVIVLGKIAYNGTKKQNLCTVEIDLNKSERPAKDWETLKELESYWEFSVSGSIWNHKQTDILSGGQNLDELVKYFSHKLKRIYELWKEYHLNDIQSGTKVQTKFLEKIGKSDDYTVCCELLQKGNLYEDRGYKYGTAWLVKQIPEEIVNEIKEIMK